MATAEKQENPLVSLLFNIGIPTIILMKFSGPEHLGPVNGLIIALLFPLCYGAYDFYDRRKFNFIALLGLINVSLTGGIGLMELDAHWIAVKEATLPAVIGLLILVTIKTPNPLIKKLLINDNLLNMAKVDAALAAKSKKAEFETLIVKCTYIFASSFFLSSALNYGLAKFIIKSPTGTTAFNEELGKMTGLSFPVIVVPSMVILFLALLFLFRGIKELTGLEWDDIAKQPPKKT